MRKCIHPSIHPSMHPFEKIKNNQSASKGGNQSINQSTTLHQQSAAKCTTTNECMNQSKCTTERKCSEQVSSPNLGTTSTTNEQTRHFHRNPTCGHIRPHSRCSKVSCIDNIMELPALVTDVVGDLTLLLVGDSPPLPSFLPSFLPAAFVRLFSIRFFASQLPTLHSFTDTH